MFTFGTSYVTIWKPNGLSKYLKDHQVIGLDLSTTVKLAVIWIILKCCYIIDLIFDLCRFNLNYFSFLL